MASRGKWISIKILTSLKQEIDTFCKNEKNGFTNSSQYIHHILRNELDFKMRNKK